MAKIAICTSTAKGLLYASFELASRLQEEGHNLVFLCPKEVENDIVGNGFEFRETPEIRFNFIPDKMRNKSLIAKIKTSFSTTKNRYNELKTSLNIPVYKFILNEVKPDLVLCDMELHEIILTSYDLGIDVKLISPWFCMRRIKGLPPLRSSNIPNLGFMGSFLGIQLSWLKFKFKTFARYQVNKLTFKNYRRRTIKAYAKEVGFPLSFLIARNFPSYFIYNDGIEILSLTMKEMDFSFRKPDNLTYLGPMVYENRVDHISSFEDNLRLQKLIKLKDQSNKKIIYCGMGSMKKGNVEFTKNLIKAFIGQSGWELIISLGRNLSPHEFENTPSNVHLFNWLPQSKLIGQVDCCINHAGMNTINECLHHQTPMLLYSWKVADQDGNAARVKYYGLGMTGNLKKDTSNDIKYAINQLLNDKKIKTKLSKFHQFYLQYKALNISEALKIKP